MTKGRLSATRECHSLSTLPPFFPSPRVTSVPRLMSRVLMGDPNLRFAPGESRLRQYYGIAGCAYTYTVVDYSEWCSFFIFPAVE